MCVRQVRHWQMGQRRSCCRQRCCSVCNQQEKNAALESRRNDRIKTGEMWTCDVGNESKKEGKVSVNWRTDVGTMKPGVFKAWAVSRTLISVDRLQETGDDVTLTKNKSPIVNMKTREIMPLRKDEGMFIVDMWVRVPTSRSKAESCSSFCTAEVYLLSEDLLRPR